MGPVALLALALGLSVAAVGMGIRKSAA